MAAGTEKHADEQGKHAEKEERRYDPWLGGRPVTFLEMCELLADEELPEDELMAHWQTMRVVKSGGSSKQSTTDKSKASSDGDGKAKGDHKSQPKAEPVIAFTPGDEIEDREEDRGKPAAVHEDHRWREERRYDPKLGGRAVTFLEMCDELADEELPEGELWSHWQSLRVAKQAPLHRDGNAKYGHPKAASSDGVAVEPSTTARPTPQARPEAKVDTATLRAELEAMAKPDLHKRAEAVGVSEAALLGTIDAKDTKEALVEVILAAQASFALGNSELCPIGYQRINDDATCTRAAAALKSIRDDREIDSTARPSGCFLFDGKMFYNSNAEGGQSLGGDRQVCQKVTAADFAVGGAQGGPCPKGYGSILSNAMCSRAAAVLKHKWDSRPVDSDARPPGCFLFEDKVFNNANAVGGPSLGGDRRVCTKAHAPEPAPGVHKLSGMFSYHKDLLPLDAMDWFTFAFSVMGLIIAAGGGIGGGGILVPLYMILLQFRPKHAIALSNFTILGGSIANTAFNVQKKLPDGRGLIDWDIIVMMEPSTITGAVLGSFASKYLPDFVLTVSLVIVLAMLSYRTMEKGISMFRKESAEMDGIGTKETEMRKLGTEEESERLMPAEAPKKEQKQTVMADHGTPWTKILLLIVCFIGCVVLTILKGSGHGSIIGVQCGTPLFWVLSFSSVPWTILFGAVFRHMLMAEHDAKVEANHQFNETDIKWDATSTIKYPLICTLAGVFAGLFGVGGGIVKGPLMLEMGVHPSVAAATAAQMILFTTMAACVSFEVFGLLEVHYGVVCFVLGLACTAIGQAGINAYMKAAKRHSPPVLSIGIVMVLSTALVAVECAQKFTQKDMSELLKPSSICSKAH